MTNAIATLPITQKALAKQDVSLLDVVRAIQLDAAAKSPAPTKVTLPKKVAVSEVQREHVENMLALVDELKLPQVRRRLTAAEKRNVLRWTQQAKSVGKLVETIVEQLKAAYFNHADVVAEESGKAVPGETPRDKYGWFLLNDKDDNGSGIVPDEPMKMTRELRTGSVTVTVDSVDQLIAEGVLTAEDRQKAVKTREFVDEEALLKIIADRPHLTLPIVAKAEQVSASSVAFQIRQNR
jgi:hypothetical protein